MIDRELHEPGCIWLNEEIVPRTGSPNTWELAARSLVGWLECCAVFAIDQCDLVAYRESYLGRISPFTGQKCSPATVRVRMTYITDFIAFAAKAGWYHGDLTAPGTTSARGIRRSIDSDPLAHTRPGEFAAVRSRRKTNG